MNISIDKRLDTAKRTVAFTTALYALAAVIQVAAAQEPEAIQEASTTDSMDEPDVTLSANAKTAMEQTANASVGVEAIVPANDAETASWFYRPPLSASFGDSRNPWKLTLFGFVQADFIYDTTRSYDDYIGAALVARSDSYEGTVGRSQFSIRNTRLGLSFETPTVSGVKGLAVLVGDFFGNQPGYPKPPPEYSTSADHKSVSENAFFNNPAFRLRHAYLKLQNDYVDVTAGQTYDVFGWQNNFFPCSVQYLGLPNQLFSRNIQIQLAHEFGKTSWFGASIAAAAVRPVQRDSSVPDINAGIRFSLNDWKGITTPGNIGTVAHPLSVGVSGTFRRFKVNAFTPPPTQKSNNASGWGISVDALIPVIPADHVNDRGNRLTLTGSYVTGTGIADLINAGGGATFPTLPNPAQANPPPIYHGDIDTGLVSFDTQGVMHTVDWWAYRAGLQYYLPPSGRLILSANFTEARSKNMSELFPKGGAEIEMLVRVADHTQYADVNLFWDLISVIRLGISGQYTKVYYLDGDKPHNLRAMGQAVYVF